MNKGHHAMLATGRLKAGQMNKTEAAYEAHLDLRLRTGELAWYKFEGITLKLANDVRYTPDFSVMRANGEMELHEVKGHWTGDAKAKAKMAAVLFPFRVLVIKKQAKRDGGGWAIEEM